MGNTKNRSRNIHALIVHGSDKWDLNCAYNFLAAVKSCYSRSIIPHALSTCKRDELLELFDVAKDEEQDGDQQGSRSLPNTPSLGSSAMASTTEPSINPQDIATIGQEDIIPGYLPPPPSTPTPQETREMLEVLRPFYRCVPQEDIKLELRSHLQTLAPKLKHSSRLLVIICAQAVHTSGCIVLGRTIVAQDIMEYIESLPMKSSAVIASIATGSDDREEIPDTWETADEQTSSEIRYNSETRTIYTVARIETIKPDGELSVEREVQLVRDAGTLQSKSDTFSGYRSLKLGPWAYLSKEWVPVDTVTGYIEEVIDKNIVLKGVSPLTRAKVTFDRGVRIVKKQEPLDLSIYYLELKFEEVKRRGEEDEEDATEEPATEHAKKGMLALSGMMKRVIDQNRKCLHAAHIISSSSLFQQRVEETLRFIERVDIRTEAFLQGAYKDGMLKFIDATGIRLPPEVKRKFLESIQMPCPEFNNLIIPPKSCVGMEYWDQANRILRLMQGHTSQYRWFRVERFLEYIAENL
ncbi:hypothetical protein TWF730_009282 [Orbilia blumenaviensis]|uniref:Uncharacterized protein n=1 Tax=Orbilia blumenaviensis TaxID=1796055 RepID=A0AAV9V4E8_9PEZI